MKLGREVGGGWGRGRWLIDDAQANNDTHTKQIRPRFVSTGNIAQLGNMDKHNRRSGKTPWAMCRRCAIEKGVIKPVGTHTTDGYAREASGELSEGTRSP